MKVIKQSAEPALSHRATKIWKWSTNRLREKLGLPKIAHAD